MDLIRVSEISKLVHHSTGQKLVSGLIFSRFDYCNSLYIGLPDSEVHLLQMILNSAGRNVCLLPRLLREHISRISFDLHFLSIKTKLNTKFAF